MNTPNKQAEKNKTFTLNDFYSELSNIANELNDDLILDLGKGENGYKTYEDSYNAIKKNTLRLINRRLNRVRKEVLKL